MFPSTALSHGASLLSSGSHRSGSPPSPILRRRYAILNCIPVAYGFASRLPRLHGFRAFAYALPSDWRRSFPGQGQFRCRLPHSGFPTRTTQGLLRFPADPFHTSAVFQDPGRIEASSPKTDSPILPPHPTKRRLQHDHDLEANFTASASAVYASRTASPLPMQDSLPAGWLAFAGRELTPLDQIERFQSLHLIPLSRAYPDAAGHI